jgi:anti-sigma-K factor RskA
MFAGNCTNEIGTNEENEVLRAARAAKEQQERAHASDQSKIGWKTAAAAGIGIGSAALIAALLYSRRDRD